MDASIQMYRHPFSFNGDGGDDDEVPLQSDIESNHHRSDPHFRFESSHVQFLNVVNHVQFFFNNF